MIPLIAAGAVILALGIVWAAVYGLAGHVQSLPDSLKKNVYIAESTLTHRAAVKNILLLGLDRTATSDSVRSDTMLLATLDGRNKLVKLTSFLRDTFVEIPGHGESKLNAACALGGAQLVADTIEYNFHIRVDHYVMADFSGFEAIIDALNGVDVAVTAREIDFLCEKTRLGTQIGKAGMLQQMTVNGKVHFNGVQALIYCRIRDLDSDFMRTKRQQKVLEDMFIKLRGGRLKIASIASDILPLLKTDMTRAQLAALALSTPPKLNWTVVKAQIPFAGTWRDARKNGADVLLCDIAENRTLLEKFIYGTDSASN
jgi:LCP family protein required for cell wall assembly